MRSNIASRPGCPGRVHTPRSYGRGDCVCPDAQRAFRRYVKHLRLGIAPPALVDATGTARRLQALSALGYPNRMLAELGNHSASYIRCLRRPQPGQLVHRDVAQRWRRLYEQYSATPGPSERARLWAKRYGFAPPLLWEGVDMDDPAARPVEDPAPPPVPPSLRKIDLDEVAYLLDAGESVPSIAKAMGFTESGITSAISRLNKTREGAA